ncbi:porin family protein [Bradyrhizobium sp. BWA-3-5]|uniref:outer membrane protein n=1 Tax=Bradyrhizobium sp. BWA-3-5 TaxID=3080013 RepID=UPI00293E909E|nr:porin family protein [Bradyrhizobium sp. BWA-3-5]WOH63081.1 porin family protein [Bradyrhizobium sp. BWA-3-5]
MKKLAITATALVLGTASASAADLAARPYTKAPVPVAAVYNWTGFYIGVNGGYAWNDSQDVAVSGSPLITAAQPLTVPFAVRGLKPEGGLAGGTVGYNWQFGRGLVGIEADFDWADIRDSRFIDLPAAGPTVRTSASQNIDFFGTVRGRLGGLATDQLLLFVTGGLAYANVKSNANVDEFFGIGRQFRASADEIRYGWTVGAGAEWKFAPNWSIKGEYLYYDLGSHTIRGNQTNPVNGVDFATYSFNTRGSIARAGINYQFSGPVVARY